MPGPWSPIELSMPRRRLGHPRRRPAGARVAHDRLRDDGAERRRRRRTGAAPGRRPRIRRRSSPGSGASARPVAGRHRTGLSASDQCPPPLRGAPRVSAASVPTSDHRDPVAAEHRTLDAGTAMRVTPSSPTTGSTHVMQTPMPHAIDSSTAVWLQAPCAVATSVHRPEHPHRSAGVDDLDRRCASSEPGSTSVTRPRTPTEPSSVVTTTDGPSACASSAPKSRSSVAGAEHHVDRAAALPQPLGEPEQRRPAVAAADEHARHRLLRGARTAGRAGRQRRWVATASAGGHAGARP